jgi:hypothetical protein
MRHLLLISALALSALTITTPSQARTEVATTATYLVNGNGVRLRAEPNVSAQELGKLSLGAAVTPLQKTPNQSTLNGKTAPWYQVKTDKATGWVFGSFLVPATNYTDAALELLRTKLKAESVPYADAVALYQLADKALSQTKSRNAKGELELAKLLALQLSYSSIPSEQMQQSPYIDWYNQHGKISFGDDPSGQYLVSADAFWKLADQYKKDPIGDEIAWQASQQRLGGECEGFIGCMSIAMQRTEGEYLKRFPKGRYVKPALANITEFLKEAVAGWKAPEQDTRDVDLTKWETILRPQAKNPNAQKALGYLKQLQALK